MAPAAIFLRQPSKVSLEVLEPKHHHILVRAIKNVLSTELAELTMAQLVDGLPLTSTGWDAQGTLINWDHPLIQHEALCDGVMDQTRAFRDAFDPRILQLDSSVMQAYQNAEIGSLQFKMRLIELVARSIHQIAVFLFQQEPKLHAGDIDSVVSWKEEERWILLEGNRRIHHQPSEPRPTLFFHVAYMDYDQYPDGLSDMAGYWAEDRIFGGVVVFDRGDSGSECTDVYFHSGRKKTTFRLWRPLDAQFDAFVGFLLSNERSPLAPFPLLVTDDNFRRHDPWDAIALHHIFRDPWERKVTPTKPPERDVRSTGDYPELEAMWTEMEKVYQVDNVEELEGRYSPTQDILVSLGILPPPETKPDGEGDTKAGNPKSDVSSLLPAMSPPSTDEQDRGKGQDQSPSVSREQPGASEDVPPARTADVSTDDQERNEGQEQSPAESCDKSGDSEVAAPTNAADSVVGKGKAEEGS